MQSFQVLRSADTKPPSGGGMPQDLSAAKPLSPNDDIQMPRMPTADAGFDLGRLELTAAPSPSANLQLQPQPVTTPATAQVNSGDFTLNFRELAPSFGTWAHLSCGMGAMFLAVGKGSPTLAAGLVFGAYVFDLVDGWMARALYKEIPTERKKLLGRYGDSLDGACDAVSFGAAPAMLLYSTFLTEATGPAAALGWAAAIGYPIAITYRLARYSLIHTQGNYFKGLFSPAGGVVATGVVAALAEFGASANVGTALTATAMAGLAVLHTSEVPYPHSKAWKGDLKQQFHTLVGIGIATGVAAAAAGLGVEGSMLCGFLAYWGSFLASPLFAKRPEAPASVQK